MSKNVLSALALENALRKPVDMINMYVGKKRELSCSKGVGHELAYIVLVSLKLNRDVTTSSISWRPRLLNQSILFIVIFTGMVHRNSCWVTATQNGQQEIFKWTIITHFPPFILVRGLSLKKETSGIGGWVIWYVYVWFIFKWEIHWHVPDMVACVCMCVCACACVDECQC